MDSARGIDILRYTNTGTEGTGTDVPYTGANQRSTGRGDYSRSAGQLGVVTTGLLREEPCLAAERPRNAGELRDEALS